MKVMFTFNTLFARETSRRPRRRGPALALLLALGAACGNEPPPSPPERGRPVVVAAATRGPVESIVEAVGEARPVRDADLAAEAVGKVVWIADEGAAIEAGGAVARLAADRMAAQAGAAEARAAQAEAEAAQARRDLEIAERLFAEGVVPRQERDRARVAVETAEAAAEAARAAAREAAGWLAEKVVRAPFAGVVLEKRAEVGEVLSPGAPVARLGDVTTLEIAAWVGEADAVRIRPGASATVSFDARPGETRAATVHRVDAALNPGSRTAEVIIRLPNPAGLPAGLLARARIHGARRHDVLRAPAAAVRTGPEGESVWTVGADGRAARRAVRIGLRGEGFVEVLSGLEAGDTVVVRGGESLAEGVLVEAASLSP